MTYSFIQYKKPLKVLNERDTQRLVHMKDMIPKDMKIMTTKTLNKSSRYMF